MQPETGWNQSLSSYKYPILLFLVGLVLLLGGLFSSGILTTQNEIQKPVYSKESITDKASLYYKVDISGQVQKPGVYALSSDSRIEDAIKLAGGVTEQANHSFLTKTINLAQKISDGMKIYIPAEGEDVSGVSTNSGSSPSNASNSVININSADISQLDSLPGVGQITAQKIVEGRPYTQVEDLVTKKVVSKSVFDKIKDRLSVI